MQISPLAQTLVSTLANSSTGTEQPGKMARNSQSESAALEAVSPIVTEDRPVGGTAETVSISAEVQAQAGNDAPVAVYAEIWKGLMKVAQVDIHGHVISYSGLVPSGGGGSGGPLLAAQRAVQVAQLTGGEIRTAGQALDGKTLLMRARLASAYVA